MALVLKDRVKETTTTTGTSTYTLAGAVTGFEAFSEIGDGNTTYYACTDGTDFEVGVGTYTASGTTLARTTILQSSNSDAAVNWTSGTRDIFCTQPAEKAVFLDASDIATFTNVDINGGAIDNVTLGTNSAITEAQIDNININGFAIDSQSTSFGTVLKANGQFVARIQSTSQNKGGGLYLYQNNPYITFEGDSADAYETNLKVTDATADRDITLPDATGTVALDESTGMTLNNGVIALKNGGAQSEVRLYCETSNAHYAGLKAPAHADFSGNVTSTLPSVTGNLIGTANADAPATTTSASDADHVLVNDGGVLKKITPSDLGIGSGGGSYANSDVDTHLNQSTASANEVLSWNGSDYDWVAQSGGGGGASNLAGLSDVAISSVQNNDLLMYNSTASEWQNTNLGLTIDPSISSITSGGSTLIGAGGPVTVVVVPSSGSYQNPAYFAEVRNSTNTSTVITNANISRSGGTLTFTAPSSAGSYIFRVKVQDFGDLQSEFVNQSFTVSAAAGPRYLRLSGSGGNTHSMVTDLTFYTGTGQTGTVYPDNIGHMTSNTAPSPLVASSSGSYGSSYDHYEAFDASISTSGAWWNLGNSATYDDWYLQLDLGSPLLIPIQSASIRFYQYHGWHGGAQTLTLETSVDGTNFTSVATLSKGNVGGVFNIG